MDHHGIRMRGDFKTNNIKSQTGNSSVVVDDDGTFDMRTGLRISFGSSPNGKVLVADSNGDMALTNQGIPSGESILFYKDTAVTGYTLITSIDDSLIYLTRGSAAGGETGGTTKSGSTWTQPNHTHGLGSHTHNLGSHTHTTGSHTLTTSEIPSHSHGVGVDPYSASGEYWWSVSLSNVTAVCASNLGSGAVTAYPNTQNTGSGNSHNHGSTGAAVGNTAAASGNTDGGSSANTWRPLGVNFTLQQKD